MMCAFQSTGVAQMIKQIRLPVVWLATALMLPATSWAGSGMAGLYVVGPDNGTDFPDLANALAQVELQGIDDDVELALIPGNHDTHVQINSISLTGNPDARLLITSADLNDMAVLTHTPTSEADNWIIRINQASRVDLVGLAFKIEGNQDLATAVVFDGGAEDINIIDNEFNAHPVSVLAQEEAVALISQLNDTVINNLQIVGNEFNEGGSVLYLNSAQVNGIENLNLSDNLITGQTVRGAMELIYIRRALFVTIEDNQIYIDSLHGNGVVMTSVNGLNFKRNAMHYVGGEQTFGLRILSSNLDSPTETVISNNFIQATQFGIKLTGLNDSVKVLNNTVVLSGTLSASAAVSSVLDSNNTRLDEVTMQGNLFINRTTGSNTRLLNVSESGMFHASDHNLMYDADGDSFVLDVTLYDDLAAYQAGTGLDLQSLSRDVLFVDEVNGDLHLDPVEFDAADLLMPANPDLIRDIDGALRASNLHRVGADDGPLPDLIFDSGFD
jgi:hypothetical protein